MSPYIEAGYAIALGSLAVYSVSLVARERAAAKRLGPRAGRSTRGGRTTAVAIGGEAAGTGATSGAVSPPGGSEQAAAAPTEAGRP
jgi:hypothetical protein